MPYRNGFGPEFRLHSDYKDAEKRSEGEALLDNRLTVFEYQLPPSTNYVGGTEIPQALDSIFDVEAYSASYATDESIYLTLILQLPVPLQIYGFTLNHRSNGYLDTSAGNFKVFACNGNQASQSDIEDVTVTTGLPSGDSPADTDWLSMDLPSTLPTAPKSLYIFHITIGASGDYGISPAPFTNLTRLDIGELLWVTTD